MYWISESAKRLLRYEAQMRRVAAVPVEDPDECRVPPVFAVEPILEHEIPDPPAKPFPPTAPEMVGHIFPFPLDERNEPGRYVALDRGVLDIYHEDAVKVAGVHWCRTDGCMHRAPADGDRCPVCADRGILPVRDETGDAA